MRKLLRNRLVVTRKPGFRRECVSCLRIGTPHIPKGRGRNRLAVASDAPFALLFVASGAFVNVLDIRANEAETTSVQINAEGGTASSHAVDLADFAQVKTLFDEFFRYEQVHILVNNAGISHIGTIEEVGSPQRITLAALHRTGSSAVRCLPRTCPWFRGQKQSRTQMRVHRGQQKSRT